MKLVQKLEGLLRWRCLHQFWQQQNFDVYLESLEKLNGNLSNLEGSWSKEL